MRPELLIFQSCPIASRFIDNREDARSYYAHRLVGNHQIDVKGVKIVVRFNPEEIHLFTDDRSPCPPDDVTTRPGGVRETRCFCRDRARRLDDVLHTLSHAAAIHQAKMPRGRIVFGPAGANAQRYAVVIAPDRDVWFVRTAYPVSADGFRQACRGGRPAPWPPK